MTNNRSIVVLTLLSTFLGLAPQAIASVPSTERYGPFNLLDVSATRDGAGRTLTLGIVNRHRDEAVTATVQVGMRTSVGHDAVQTAAAVRAGINRFAAWTELSLAKDEDPALAAAAVLPSLGNGPWTDKWDALLSLPTREALWQAGLYDFTDRGAGAGIGIYLAVPHTARRGVSSEARAAFLAEVDQRWSGVRSGSWPGGRRRTCRSG